MTTLISLIRSFSWASPVREEEQKPFIVRFMGWGKGLRIGPQ